MFIILIILFATVIILGLIGLILGRFLKNGEKEIETNPEYNEFIK